MDEPQISVLEVIRKLGIVPIYGWEARFDHEYKIKCRPFTVPRASQMSDILGMSFRYAFRFYIKKRFIQHRSPFIDAVSHVPWRPIYGVPIGGIGSGSIGRGYCGEFCRSSLIPGMYCYDVQPVDQFIVTVRKSDVTVYHQVLSPLTKPPSNAKRLKKWKWGFDPENGHYVGLYPRSWTLYEIPELQLVLVCQQISPVIPHDYQETCLPVAIFYWKVISWNNEDLRVTITFSWHGPNPRKRSKSSDVSKSEDGNISNENTANTHVSTSENASPVYSQRSTAFSAGDNVLGCLLERTIGGELPCCFGIAAKSMDKVEVSRCPGFCFHDKALHGTLHDSRHNPEVSGNGHSDLITYLSYTKAPSASQFWNNLQYGQIPPDFHSIGYTVPLDSEAKKSPKLAIAVSATTNVPRCNIANNLNPSQSELEFAITWHSPIVKFRTGDVVYTRRYVRWFPVDGIPGAKLLLKHAIDNWRQWVQKIEDWQNPILNNQSLPNWYKSALFNELYYLSDGGTVWLDPIQVDCFKSDLLNCIPLDLVRSYKNGVDLDPYKLTGRKIKTPTTVTEDMKVDSWDHRARLSREIGLFGYLEGHEYRMYNTYDVHHDASWALIKLWPKIQLALNYDCADLAIAEDSTSVYYIYNGKKLSRSSECAVVHDFGDPEDEPWRCTNAYIMFPTDKWKDLNSKFILQVWRDWRITQDHQYLLYMLPIVLRILRKSLVAWDSDDDGLIENSGFPDQTYDVWTAKGLTAYTGGIWLSCLYATFDMLSWCLKSDSPVYDQIVNNTDDTQRSWSEVKDEIQALFTKARDSYNAKLWTGSYYAFQTHCTRRREVIMAGQLSGYWFSRITGVPPNLILPKNHVVKTLQTISNCNWHGIENGTIGAINGCRPVCKPDLSSIQAEEFWVGVNYSLSALMIAEGMVNEGLALGEKCYNTIYNLYGLQYQTPEAYMSDGRFRCPGYMRALAIWSIQQALEFTNIYKYSDASKFSATFTDI
ncbi:unnamed protein product [Schistosoma haematobium]|nr:unnamed protein product [Schistosoma haematobium]